MVELERVTRGNLPHWYVPGAAHFVTYRLAGTIPDHVLEELHAKKQSLLQRPLTKGMTERQRAARAHKLLFADYDRYLDQQRDLDWLSNPAVASLIRRNLYHHNAVKYHLLAYCVMPNHVHVLLQPTDAGTPVERDEIGERADTRSPLTAIMHSLKSYTAHEANALLERTGTFWQHESYDHWIRDEDELARIVAYIVENPRKAGLVPRSQDWFYCSAHDRFIYDGDTSGYLAYP